MFFKGLEKFIIRNNDGTQEQRSKILGSLIKKNRLDNKQTLVEFAKDNMSVSYLSKLENGKVFPSDFVFEEILSKVNLNKEIFEYAELYDSLLGHLVRFIFLGNQTNQERIFTKVRKITNYDMRLIKFIHFIMTKNKEEADRYAEIIYESRENLSDIELEAFMCFSLIKEIDNKDFAAAIQYKNLIEKMNYQNTYLNALNKKSFCLMAFAISHEMEFFNLVNDYKIICGELGNFSQIIEISYLLATVLCHKGYYKCGIKIIRHFPIEERRKLSNYPLLQVEFLIGKKDYEQAFLLLKAHPKSFSRIEGIFYSLRCKELLKDEEYVKTNLERLKNIDATEMQSEQLIFFRYLELKYAKSPLALRNFLRGTITNFIVKTGSFYLWYEYSEYLKNDLEMNSWYKEFVQLLKIFEKKHKEICIAFS